MSLLLILTTVFIVFVLGFLIGHHWRYFSSTFIPVKFQSFKILEFTEKSYFKGLNYLLNDQTDEAIETFTEVFEVSPHTIETHLALGNLLRKRGEIDKAIQIHQNLLASSQISSVEINYVSLELARDFMAAGLFDRAERLLKKLAHIEEITASWRSTLKVTLQWESLDVLLDIYQQTNDWDQAIWAGEQLLRYDRAKYKQLLAQFLCEKTQVMINTGNFEAARGCIEKAVWFDSKCVRAILLEGELEFRLGNFKQSIKVLKRVANLDKALLVEAIPLLEKNYECLNLSKEWHDFLCEILNKSQEIYILVIVFESLNKTGQTPIDLYQVMIDKLNENPSLQSLKWLLKIKQQKKLDGLDDDLLIELVQYLIKKKAKYCCNHCGFTSKILYWLCPSCRHWNTMRPISI